MCGMATTPAQQHQSMEQSEEDLFNTDEFRMYAYKILPCSRRGVHEWSTCPYSHPNEKARRRDPRLYSYLAIPCEATKQGGSCPRGDDCPNCHSLFEYWLHPSRYRTQLCRDMENGHCKRQVCFFAHSIEELRVPDHSHLNIPPEMQAAAAAASGTSSGSRTSTDTGAAGSSDSSGSSTPRASSRDSDSSSKAASKPPQSNGSKALNISFSASSAHRSPNSRASRYSSNSLSPTTQWSSLASTPAPAFLGNSCSSPGGYYTPAMTAASALEHHRAVLQLQQCQMRAQGLSPAGSMYEQQLQHMLLAAQAESAQAQQQVQLMMLQQNQQAAAWGAHLARSSMGSVKGASPPLSPVPSSLMADAPASYGGDSRSYFVPPSHASRNSASAMAAVQAGWQSAALMRSMSTPANTGSGSSLGSNLMRQSSAYAGMSNYASSNGAAVQMHSSAGSSIDGQQDMTLASLLAASSQGLPADTQSWGAGAATPSMSLGMATSAGLPLGYGGSGAGMGGYLGGGSGLDATASLLLLQQQQQQKAALGNAVNLLQSMNGGQMGNGGGQAVNDMLGMMMQQLMLQQQSAVM